MSTPPDTDPASMPRFQALEMTGEPQLDLVLGGGLPRGALVVLLGPPGSGKTTLASQIAFSAAARGQRVLLLAALRARGVTLLAIKEIPKVVTTQLDFSADALAILAENVLLVQQLAYRGHLHRVLSVLKMRFSHHDSTLRELRISAPEGIHVLTPDESGYEVLAGLSRQQARPEAERVESVLSSEASSGESMQ